MLLKSRKFLVVLLICTFVFGDFGYGLILPPVPVAEAAQVSIDPLAQATGSSHLMSGSQSVFIDDQTGYKFFRDGPGYCVYRKTTNGGLSWSATTTVDTQLDCINIVVWYDKWTPGDTGTNIHIATLDTSASDTFYNRLNTTNDSLLLTTSTSTSLSQGGTITAGVNTVSITKGTDGTLYMSSIDNSDSYVVECSANCNLAANWSETGTRPFGLNGNAAMLMPLTGGNILAIHRDIVLEDMGSKVWNNGTGAWDAATTTFDFSATDNTTYDVGMAATLSSTSPGTIYLAYIASSTALGTDDEVRTAKYSGGTWTLTGDVITGTTRGLTNVAIGLDAANDNVYVAYTGQTTAGTANTGRAYYKWATSSMTNWSAEVGPLDTAQNDLYGIDINKTSDERLFATWFNNGLDDILGDTIADVYPGIRATSTATQTRSVEAGTPNFYVGGKFVITENYKSQDVTSVTITETGTIDASTQLSNVELFYEMDTLWPYNCASVSYDGGESPFGSTDVDGFSGPNGSSTFTGTSVTVSTTSALCLYPVMDVSASTTGSSTIEIAIEDPSVDVVVTGGVAIPTTFIGIASTTIVHNDRTEQVHYHWRNNDGTEVTATSSTGGIQDTPLTEVPQLSTYRLRLEVSNEGSTSTPAIQYRLEYAQKLTTCSAAGGWTDVGAADDAWNMSTSQLTEAGNTTNIATSSGGVKDENLTFLTTNGGQRETTSQTGNITLSATQFVELEYSIEASTSSIPSATYCFRLTNAGTPLDTYTVYPEATVKNPTDFFVQRGVITLTGGSVTITAGVDYEAPRASTSAFIRITNTHYTGAGDNAATANQNSNAVTAYITNPSNLETSVTFARAAAAISNTRVAWEIVEYIGTPGGENEIKVHQQSALTYGATSLTATTSAATGVVDDADIVVFITGQFNPDAGRTNYNAGLSTAAWNASADTASFTRGEATGAVITSYAIVEFTGSNWFVQRTADHAYSAAGTTETEDIAAVGSLTRAFIHTQKRVGLNLNQHEDFGHEVWLSSIGQVSFRLDSGANTVGSQISVAWVIENTQTTGDFMEVTRTNGTSTPASQPNATSTSIGKTLDDITVSSIFINNRGSGASVSYPEPMIAARLISTTQYEIWVSNNGNNRIYQTEIVEWPSARRKITQNYYRIYVNNNALEPTDPWPVGAADVGENTEVTGLDEPIATGDTVRIRMSLAISSGAMIAGADAFRLQYAPRVTTCTAIDAGAWSNLGDIGSTTALWRATSTPETDGTALSTDPPAGGALKLSVSDVAGTFEEENDTAVTPYIVPAGEDVEYDWAIQNNAGASKTSYCFRMIESNGTVFIGYNNYPTIRTVGFGAQSQAWRWYDDAEQETPVTTLAATNSAPIDIDFDNAIMLRMTLREVNGATGNNIKYKLQFSESSSFATTTDVSEVGTCTNLSYWCYTDGGGVDNALVTTRTLGDTHPCVAGVGDGCGTHNESGTTTSTYVHKKGAASEFAFTIRSSGARTNRVYYFRAYDVTNNEPVPLGTSSPAYPSLVTKGASLTFVMSGIASSTTLEGVTTDFATGSTTINFGSVPIDTMREGAHRFVVNTNGTQGYQLFMTMSGDLTTSSGSTIGQVTATNAAPLAWATGCAAEARSCFGYHTSDDTLYGGSTRFSAIDTYARLSTTTLDEVGYSSQPIVGDSVDVVFRMFVRQSQDAGQYEARIRYISVPMF